MFWYVCSMCPFVPRNGKLEKEVIVRTEQLSKDLGTGTEENDSTCASIVIKLPNQNNKNQLPKTVTITPCYQNSEIQLFRHSLNNIAICYSSTPCSHPMTPPATLRTYPCLVPPALLPNCIPIMVPQIIIMEVSRPCVVDV